jgi:tetratricopeptide (TPR) repeat protein
MKRLVIPFASILLVLISASITINARDTWVKVRSKDFLVIGNGSEKEITEVAVRLAQFRDVISHELSENNPSSPVPTTVIVFKSDDSYRPFKINESNAGYFQPSTDVNYITLSTEVRGDQDPFSIIFHEYTHLLVNNTIGNAPPWFNEGLAEYYSTFRITDDHQVELGRPVQRHLLLLRQKTMLPLRTLFQVDYNSPYYNEADKKGVFYAQSWALMHYLLQNKDTRRATEVRTFLNLLNTRIPLEQAFHQAFQTTLEIMETELRSYVQQNNHRVFRTNFESKDETPSTMTVTHLAEAEVQAYLGDLLLHGNRAEAESYLQRALMLDPNLALAHAALGMLRFRQGKPDEARASLARAVAANSQDYLIHFYYAYVLAHPREDKMLLGVGYSPETALKIREELRKAIALRPDFLESYNLLAYINLETNTEIDETIEMLTRALSYAPGRRGFVYMLGQLYMQKDDYKQARPLLEQVLAADVVDRVRSHAQRLLSTITEIEEQKAKQEAARRARGLTVSHTDGLDATTDQTTADPWSDLREVLRIPAQGEKQLQGILLRIECASDGLIFVVRTADHLWRLRTDSFARITRTTYTADVKGMITCGARSPENAVVVCYVPTTDKLSKVDGLLRSVEFVPGDFRLTPVP